MENNEKEQLGNNQTIQPNMNSSVNDVPSVMPPSVAPPSVGGIEELTVDEDDGVILKPHVDEPVVEEVPKVEEVVAPVEKEEPQEQLLENKKMEKVEIEYKPPSKLKMFLLVFTFVLVLGVVLFLPQITEFINKANEEEEPVVNEQEIANGTLVCDLETNNDKYDLIYSTEFTFVHRMLKSVNVSSTTKGDINMDLEELNKLYTNCNSASTELSSVTDDYGINVSCDMFEGTVKIDQSIDYGIFNLAKVSPIFEKYAIDLPDFEGNQNIGDIEKEMKSSGYTCTMNETKDE